ncbi:MAG: hypothetical protein MN733_00795 [Nitrososphaera sp.]|nr:hypothetical protein [Nitrososphaera sp.]
MKQPNKCVKHSLFVTIGVVLFASLFLIGFIGSYGTVTPVYGAMMEDKGSDSMAMAQGSGNMSDDSMMIESKMMHHLLRGQISNVQFDSSGTPEWIQSGIWVLRASIGQDNELQSAQLIARFSMVKPDGTAMHVHKVHGFKPTEFSTEQNGTIRILDGPATVTMSSGPVADVPLTLKIFNESVIGIWIGPDKVDGHFGSNPIYGILSTPSRGIMSEMGSTMMDDKGGGSMIKEQNLTETSIPVTIPLTRGYANGHEVFYISTEASDADLAAHLTSITGSRVAYAPALSRAPPASLANIYAFENGIEGTGPLGFQPNVADSEPGDAQYSPLWRIILVEWKAGVIATELKSEQEITAALEDGDLTIEPTAMVVNCAFVQWEGGSLLIREDQNLTDKSAYGPGQVLEIDIENMEVTFVAHRGFAPDGSTIYYIATDASNPDVANALGVTFVNKTGATTLTGASSDLWVFTNGIKGTGPMGFQASIAGSDIGDDAYSPMWRIIAASWNVPSTARFLTASSEIGAAVSGGMLSTEVAGFVVNCPFVDVGVA